MSLIAWFRRPKSARMSLDDDAVIRRFGKLIARAFEAGDLDAINALLLPVVYALRSGSDAIDDCSARSYVVSTRFLRHACHELFDRVGNNFREVFFYVGGFRPPGSSTYVWDHLVEVEFEKQSAIGVRVDMQSAAVALRHLRDMGLFVVGHIHSHPGYGPAANHPSATDLQFVETLASGRSAAIGAIVSRGFPGCDDAYLRFFAAPSAGPYRVLPLGAGVEELSDDLFRITEPFLGP